MKSLSTAEREAKTRHQLTMIEEQLTKEFCALPADVVHHEVESVSEALLAEARFSEHVAVLTGRFAAERLRAAETLALSSSA